MTQVVIVQDGLALLFNATDVGAEQIAQFKVSMNVKPETMVRIVQTLSSLMAGINKPVPVPKSVDVTKELTKTQAVRPRRKGVKGYVSQSGVSRNDIIAWAQTPEAPRIFTTADIAKQFPTLSTDHARNRIQALIKDGRLTKYGSGKYYLTTGGWEDAVPAREPVNMVMLPDDIDDDLGSEATG